MKLEAFLLNDDLMNSDEFSDFKSVCRPDGEKIFVCPDLIFVEDLIVGWRDRY